MATRWITFSTIEDRVAVFNVRRNSSEMIAWSVLAHHSGPGGPRTAKATLHSSGDLAAISRFA